jgi:hypothetical protein
MNVKKALTRLALVGLIGGTTVLTAGCWEIVLGIELLANDDSSSDPYVSYDAGPYGARGTFDVTAQSLRGDLGPRSFEGGVWMQSGYDYGGEASIEIDARNRDEDWNVMTRLDIEGGLAHPDLVPGAVLTFDDYYSSRDRGGARAYISVLGCAGPADGGWDFDSHADQVTVEVQEGSSPDYRRLHFVATWDDASTVEGTVEYRWN